MTKKISQLPIASTLDGSEKIEIVQGGVSKQTIAGAISATSSPALTDWDMSSNLFPASSVRGKRYYGVNGPTTSLVDRIGGLIPNNVFITSLSDNASTTDPNVWAIEYTIN